MPIGTILPFAENLADMPQGWKLCDGTNGTPDLRDRFLQSYGTNTVMQNIEPGLPNIKGKAAYHPESAGMGGYGIA